MEEYEVQQPVEQPKPSRGYSALECIYAWICMFAGYLFCQAFPVGENPLGGFLLIVFLFVGATVLLKLQGHKLGLLPVLAAVSAVAVAGALVISANRTVLFFAYTYGILMYCYYLYAATGNAVKAGISNCLLIDFFKAMVVMPFAAFGHMLKAMFSGKAKAGGKFLGKVLLGVVLAFVPTLMVLVLLAYDAAFVDLLKKLFYHEGVDVFSHVWSLLFGVPLGMFFYGALIASTDRKCSQVMTADGCQKAGTQMRIAPAVTAVAAVVPVLFLYVVFFISQWGYYTSGFTGILPEEFSYAEYAREGFFELCTVSVINLVILLVMSLFMRREQIGQRVIFKVITVAFCLCTLVLISTAIAKLVMYIDSYGLTPRRVHAAWFMCVLAIMFVLAAVGQFVKKLPVAAASVMVTVVLFAALGLSNVDGYIAKYNVDRYLDGTLSSVDVEAMEDLGLSAVPQMARLYQTLEPTAQNFDLRKDTKEFLEDMRREYMSEKDHRLFVCTVPYLRAKKALDAVPKEP